MKFFMSKVRKISHHLEGWVIGQQMDWQATLDEYRIGTFFSHQPLTTDPEVVRFDY